MNSLDLEGPICGHAWMFLYLASSTERFPIDTQGLDTIWAFRAIFFIDWSFDCLNLSIHHSFPEEPFQTAFLVQINQTTSYLFHKDGRKENQEKGVNSHFKNNELLVWLHYITTYCITITATRVLSLCEGIVHQTCQYQLKCDTILLLIGHIFSIPTLAVLVVYCNMQYFFRLKSLD